MPERSAAESFATGRDAAEISLGEITALMGDRIYPTYSVTDAIRQGVLVVIISALAALYPAWQAGREEPAEALHHV